MVRRKIPATIITGFLGAGKTTLLRRLLRETHGVRMAVIVNEFGDVGIDGTLLRNCGEPGCEAGTADIVELSNGCICCTVADDFLPVMSRLLESGNPPDHIVIETSGLSLPEPLLRAFGWPQVRSRVTIDGVIVVVDGAAMAQGYYGWAEKEGKLPVGSEGGPSIGHVAAVDEVFSDQLAAADMVLLNKTDLLARRVVEDLVSGLRGRVRQGVHVMECVADKIDVRSLFGLEACAEKDVDSRIRGSGEGSDDHDHDHDDFTSFVVETGVFATPEEAVRRIGELVAGDGVLRVKGMIPLSGRDGRLVVQAVGPRIETYFDRVWGAGEVRRGHLVVIGLRGMDRQALTAAVA